MPVQGNFYKYLKVDKARGMLRVLAGCVADTNKTFHGVSRHLSCHTHVFIYVHACHFPPHHVNLFMLL